MQWLAQLLGGTMFKIFGDSIVSPILNAYMKAKDVNLEEFKTANTSVVTLSAAILDANVRFAQIKSTYVITVLGWWPFRVILWFLLTICALRFGLIAIDATLPKIMAYPAWNIDPITGAYGDAEKQFLAFFIIAKPVDTAISGALDMLSKWLSKR